VVPGVATVDGTEGQRRREDRDEHEDRDSNGLLVKIDHLGAPVSSDSGSEFLDQAFAVWLAWFCKKRVGEFKQKFTKLAKVETSVPPVRDVMELPTSTESTLYSR